MLKYELRTDRKPVNIHLEVAVNRPSKIRIACVDPRKKRTIFTDRWSNIKKSGQFDIRLPQSPEKCLLIVQNMTDSSPDAIKITELKKTELKRYLPCVPQNKKVRAFIQFAQEFSLNATIFDTGSYYSDNGKFRIDYLPVISQDGQVLNTPARISNTTGRMEISKAQFVNYTVPMRMAILLHEFSHFHMNIVQSDEIEADLNALKMYLGLGYPVIEAHKSFLNVFKNTPSDQNRERYDYLKAFIDNFENIKHRICLAI